MIPDNQDSALSFYLNVTLADIGITRQIDNASFAPEPVSVLDSRVLSSRGPSSPMGCPDDPGSAEHLTCDEETVCQ